LVAFSVTERVVQLRVFAGVLALLAVCPAGALAAMVTPKAGEVRIGTGQGFQSIVEPTEAAAGAQIMVGPNGAALIAYSETCVVKAPAEAITIVENQSPCASMPEPSHFGFVQSNEDGADAKPHVSVPSELLAFTPKVDAADKYEAPEKPEAPKKSHASVPKHVPKTVQDEERPWDHDRLLIVGGAVVAGGVLAAILANQGGDHPASP
jgi:hypothetical protein